LSNHASCLSCAWILTQQLARKIRISVRCQVALRFFVPGKPAIIMT